VVILKLLDVVEQIENPFLNGWEFDTGNVNSTVYPGCVMIGCIAAAGRMNVQV
jgi:hypothetical protein